jgi:hypothetical protein
MKDKVKSATDGAVGLHLQPALDDEEHSDIVSGRPRRRAHRLSRTLHHSRHSDTLREPTNARRSVVPICQARAAYGARSRRAPTALRGATALHSAARASCCAYSPHSPCALSVARPRWKPRRSLRDRVFYSRHCFCRPDPRQRARPCCKYLGQNLRTSLAGIAPNSACQARLFGPILPVSQSPGRQRARTARPVSHRPRSN